MKIARDSIRTERAPGQLGAGKQDEFQTPQHKGIQRGNAARRTSVLQVVICWGEVGGVEEGSVAR